MQCAYYKITTKINSYTIHIVSFNVINGIKKKKKCVNHKLKNNL